MKVKPNAVNILNTVLFTILITLILVIACGTVWALVFREKKETSIAVNSAETVQAKSESSDALAMFTGIGRLRIPLEGKNGEPVVLIVNVIFPYDGSDIAFKEELSGEIANFRDIIRRFLGGLSPDEDILSNDELLKNNLLQLMNTNLHLGKIKELYLSEFLIVD